LIAHAHAHHHCVIFDVKASAPTSPYTLSLHDALPIYLIQRFDRRKDEQGWIRLHSIDACQLLGLDRAYKYTAGSVDQLARLASMCLAPAIARTQLFNWLVFNVLVGNTDAHLKNLSFLVDHQGIRLAPFYDLISTAVYDTRAFDRDGW